MSLISVVLALIVLGVCLYLVEAYIPMSPPIKTILRVVVVVAIVLWLLQAIGFVGPTLPRFR